MTYAATTYAAGTYASTGASTFTAAPVAVPGLWIEIDDEPFTDLYRYGTLRITQTLGSIGLATLEIEDPLKDQVILVGHSIRIYHLSRLIFAGSVDRVEEDLISGNDAIPYRRYALRCQSHTAIASRRTITAAYERQRVSDIVRDIVDVYLTEEGVTDAVTDIDVDVGPIAWQFSTIAAALDRLGKLAAATWWIDDDKALRFTPLGESATLSLGDGNRQAFRGLSLKRSRTKYRNVHTLLGGVGVGAPRKERKIGDGETTSWAMQSELGAKPVVRVNGVAQTVGIRGLHADEIEDSFQFFWRKGEPSISQNSAHETVPLGALIEVEYQPLQDLVLTERDDAEVAARAAVEGGSGKHEAHSTESGVDSLELARAIAEAEIRRYGRINSELEIELALDSIGLVEIGQMLTVDLTREGIDDEYLVTRLQLRELGRDHVAVSLLAIDTEFDGGFGELFKLWSRSASDYGRDRSQVVTPAALVKANVWVSDDASNTATGNNLCDQDADPYTWFGVGSRIGGRYREEGQTWIRGSRCATRP